MRHNLYNIGPEDETDHPLTDELNEEFDEETSNGKGD